MADSRQDGDAVVTNGESDEYRNIVRQAWRAVLEMDDVDCDVNFFTTGGSSRHMVRVRSALVSTLGREISLVALYRYPTINSLARYLANGNAPIQGHKSTYPGPGTSDERARRRAARRLNREDSR